MAGHWKSKHMKVIEHKQVFGHGWAARNSPKFDVFSFSVETDGERCGRNIWLIHRYFPLESNNTEAVDIWEPILPVLFVLGRSNAVFDQQTGDL